MTRTFIALLTVLALATASVATATAAEPSTATASAKTPKACKKLKGKKRSRCVAKAKRCKKGQV